MGARRIVVEFLGRDTSLGKTADQAESKMGKLQGKFKQFGAKAGPVLAAGFLAGGAAMVKFGNQASDLAETQSKVAQIFGRDSVAALDKFASGAAKNLGQSKQTALDAAATFGIIGKSAGKSGQDLVDFSTRMTGLAGDMASFNNTSPQEAIEAIGAAMRGESEPIRKYGVLLDDATLRNQAMKMGLIKTTKEALTPQQKALAAQAVILKQTKDQQGDFARTSTGLANKQRILKAEFENMTTQLGTKALPIMLKVTDWAMGAIKWMGKHQSLIKGIATVVLPLVAGLYLLAKAQMAVNFAMTANPIGLVIVAIAALAAGLIYAYKHSETFRKIVNGAFEAIIGVAKTMWYGVLKPVFKFIVDAFLNVAGAIVHGAAKAFGWVPGLGPKLKAAASNFDEFRDKVNRSLNGIKDKKVKLTAPGAGTLINDLQTIKTLMHDISHAKASYTSKGGPKNLNQLLGGRASGGPVSAGGAYLVGEKGPEILKMGSAAGTIVPNHKLAAGGGTVVNFQVHFNGVVGDEKAVARQLRTLLMNLGRTLPGGLALP